jgi:trigger factor
VELKKHRGFSASTGQIEVPEEEIEKTISNVREQLAKLEECDPSQTVSQGLFVQLDYEASEAGKVLPESSGKGALFEVGGGTLTPQFEEAIFGLKATDEKSFTVNFPTPEKEEERTPFSGRSIDFQVKLLSVRKKVVPEPGEEFAKGLGFSSWDDFKSRVREDLKSAKEEQRARDDQERAIAWLIENNPIEDNETMISQQLQNIAIDASLQLQKMGMEEQKIEEQLSKWAPDMRERAVRQVRGSLLLDAVAKAEGIEATEPDVQQEIGRIAVQSKQSPQDVVQDLQKKGLIGNLFRQVRELKALAWVVKEGSQ